MKKVFLFLVILSSGVQAKTFKMNGDLIDFERHSSGLLVNGCDKGCEALKVLTIPKYNPNTIKKETPLAASLGSDACHYLLGGTSRLGSSLRNNDGRDFCLFKDKSMVEIGSLTDYLEKNKVKK